MASNRVVPMLYKKTLLLLILAFFVFTTLFDGGCTKKPQGNTPVEESFSTAPITTKVSKDLSAYQKEFIEFQDYSQYLSNLNSVNELVCYGNIALLNAGIEMASKEHPQAVVHYTNMFIIDLKSHKIIRTIKYDKEDGFNNVFPYGINENWIVYQENDDDEFNPNFVFYAINRKTNETKKLIERRRGHDDFFTKGELVPSNTGLRIESPQGILRGNKFYFKIYLTADKVDEKGGIPAISDSIYEVDLNTGNIKKIIHITEKYGGIATFSVNDHYLAYCLAKRDFEKERLVEDIYLYSLENGKLSKFTDNGVCENPRLTEDNWIIYQVWLPEALSSDATVFAKSMGKPAFYNIIRPINKEKPVLKVSAVGTADNPYPIYPTCTDISPDGRFIFFEEPFRLLDRKTNTLITLKGVPSTRLHCFADENTLVNFWVVDKRVGLLIIDISKLLKLSN